MRRRAFVLGGFAVVWAAAAPRPDRRVLRLAAAPLGHDIDPYRDAERGVDELAWLYADGLVGWDGQIVPLLAERLPDVADDGRTYRYRLRAATWHDGRVVTARDVADAFAEVRASVWGTHEPYALVRDILVRGERDFAVQLYKPHSRFARSFFGPYGAPALPLIRRDGAAVPIGTGPFAVRAHADLGRWTLERWTASPRGASSLDAIDLRLLTTDLTANVQLLAGEADIALPLPSNPLGGGRFSRVRRITSTAVLLFNTEGLLRTTALRRAFAAVADVPAVQRAYDRRRTELLASLLLAGGNDAAFAASLGHHREAAAALRNLTNERDLVLAYVAGSSAHERTMTLLQQTLREAGVSAALRPSPAAIYAGLDGPLRSGRFDVAIDGFAYDDQPDLGADWSCANRPPGGGNVARWCDSTFDAAVARGDRDAALRRLYDEVTCIPLSRAYEEIGVAARVGGFTAPAPLIPATYGCVRWTVTVSADRR